MLCIIELQAQVLDLASIRRLRAMLSKSQQKKAERKELDQLNQDSITEGLRYSQARYRRIRITRPHNASIQIATARYSDSQSLLAPKSHD